MSQSVPVAAFSAAPYADETRSAPDALYCVRLNGDLATMTNPNSALVGPEEETILRSPTVSAPVNAAAHQQGGEIAFARRLQEQVQSRAKVLAR